MALSSSAKLSCTVTIAGRGGIATVSSGGGIVVGCAVVVGFELGLGVAIGDGLELIDGGELEVGIGVGCELIDGCELVGIGVGCELVDGRGLEVGVSGPPDPSSIRNSATNTLLSCARVPSSEVTAVKLKVNSPEASAGAFMKISWSKSSSSKYHVPAEKEEDHTLVW
jgi:hypothetical protein